MLFDEQLSLAHRYDLDRQAARVGTHGAQTDLLQAMQARRRRPALLQRVREFRAGLTSQGGPARIIAPAAEPTA